MQDSNSAEWHDRLYAARVLRRLSQQAVAGMLGVSQSHYSRIESGDRDPSPELRDAIDAEFFADGPSRVAA